MSALHALLKQLDEAFPTAADRRSAVHLIGLPPGVIDLEGIGATVWHRIVREVDARDISDGLRAMLDTYDHPHIVPLVDAWLASLQAEPADARVTEAETNRFNDADLLPKLIDRETTSWELKKRAQENMQARLAGQDGTAPHFGVVVIGNDEDGIEAFPQRFADFDSEETWETLGDGWGGWAAARHWRRVEIDVVLPKKRFDPAHFASQLEHEMIRETGPGEIHERYPDCALAVFTNVYLCGHHSSAETITRLWLDLWSARLSGEVAIPVMPVLGLIHDFDAEKAGAGGSILSRLWRRATQEKVEECPRYRQLHDDARRAIDARTGGPVSVEIADQLHALERFDFDQWERKHKLYTRIAEAKRQSFLDLGKTLFGGEGEDERRVRMAVFVRKIQYSGLFSE